MDQLLQGDGMVENSLHEQIQSRESNNLPCTKYTNKQNYGISEGFVVRSKFYSLPCLEDDQ